MLNTSHLCNINNGIKAPLVLMAGVESVPQTAATTIRAKHAFSGKHSGLISRRGERGVVKAELKPQQTTTGETSKVNMVEGRPFVAIVTVQKKFDSLLSKQLGANGGLNDTVDNSVGETLHLELVSTDPDPPAYAVDVHPEIHPMHFILQCQLSNTRGLFLDLSRLLIRH